MSDQLHIVLGASGASGLEVMNELQQRNLPVKAVTRHTKIPGMETLKADLKNAEEVKSVVAGASHVYLCVGLPYQSKIWEKDWEVIMSHVIEACAEAGARLIFLDNVYMYGPAPLPVPFDEMTSQVPVSRKGKARKRTADMLLDAVKTGKVKALIGRAADFYGAKAVNSPFYIAFLEKMLEGENPQSLAPAGIKHTYANVADNGRALVELALAEDCYGQVWHLPVGEPITVEAMTALFNEAMNKNFKVQFLPPLVRKLLAIFVKPLKEVGEMMYQFESDYVMSWQKFQNRFPDFKVTPYPLGVKKMVEWFQENPDTTSNL